MPDKASDSSRLLLLFSAVNVVKNMINVQVKHVTCIPFHYYFFLHVPPILIVFMYIRKVQDCCRQLPTVRGFEPREGSLSLSLPEKVKWVPPYRWGISWGKCRHMCYAGLGTDYPRLHKGLHHKTPQIRCGQGNRSAHLSAHVMSHHGDGKRDILSFLYVYKLINWDSTSVTSEMSQLVIYQSLSRMVNLFLFFFTIF